MSNKRIDWTQYVVPRVNENRPHIEAQPRFLRSLRTTDKAFRTTDKVYIKSLYDIKNMTEPEVWRHPSDFARLFGGGFLNLGAERRTLDGKPGGCTAFRERTNINLLPPLPRGVAPAVVDNYVTASLEYTGRTARRIVCDNLCPALSLRVPQGIDAENISSEIGEIAAVQSADGKTLYHTIELGEFPQSFAAQEMQEELEKKYNGGYLSDGLKCTGRHFTTTLPQGGANDSAFRELVGIYRETKEVVEKLNPEFAYNGERYVRVARANKYKKDDRLDGRTYVWVKVEPIKFRISNYSQFAKGKTDILELDSDETLVSLFGILGGAEDHRDDLWQNSPSRAYLNSAKASELDGNPQYQMDSELDFGKSGFLYEALDMTRGPMREYTIPKTVSVVEGSMFPGCVGLQRIIIPPHVKKVEIDAFAGCTNAQVLIQSLGSTQLTTNNRQNLPWSSFYDISSYFASKYIYISRDTDQLILSPYEDPQLKNDYMQKEIADTNTFRYSICHKNYLPNWVQVAKWKEQGQIKFIPPDLTLKVFPPSEMQNYFVNNNQKRWGELVKTLGLNGLQGIEKDNSLTDLMKIYYAIGGFSENQGESQKAYEYVKNYVATTRSPNATPKEIGAEIHQRFSQLNIEGAYNPTFAKFFMKYYHKNPDFMKFNFVGEEVDYLCAAHNTFDKILAYHPNKLVNTTSRNMLLSPELVAKSSIMTRYEQVDSGNELLAETVGKFGYTQEQFEHIQQTYNKAKTIQDEYVITADKAKAEDGITFRVLQKDDPYGFVIGDLTNCCQRIGGTGGSCVDDGYTNPHAGFMVFEETLRDKEGNPTEERRILGQAYIWYDPVTRTVCYDNIEVPKNLLEEMRKASKSGDQLSTNALLDTVVESADAVMTAMNRNGVPVDRVTTGKGYNNLRKELDDRFGPPETHKLAKHRRYAGYSDADKAQYVIRTYDQTTREYSAAIRNTADAIQADLAAIHHNAQSQAAVNHDNDGMNRG